MTEQYERTLRNIPQFYFEPTSEETKLKQRARAIHMQNVSKESVANEELQNLWMLLEKSVESRPDCQKIDYLEFKRVGASLNSGSNLTSYFTAFTFGRLLESKDDYKISILAFFNYVMRKIWLNQARIALTLLDSEGNGYITERELEGYIRDLIITLPKLNQMDPMYHPFYCCVAVRKFFFFLDPLRHKRIKITEILYSGFLDELLELRNEELCRSKEDANWFSAANTIRLYHTYISLDENHNGMLSKQEFYNYGNLTNIFVDRLFEVCMTYHKEIDFKTFIIIVLALENRKEVQSIYFFFSILDVNQDGYLSEFSLRYFFKAIQDKMIAQGHEPIKFDDFCDEVFDMISPTEPKKIYINDLIRSGYADTLCSILIDYNGFYAYENRESNIHANRSALHR